MRQQSEVPRGSILLNIISNPDADKRDNLSKSEDDAELGGLDYKESKGCY